MNPSLRLPSDVRIIIPARYDSRRFPGKPLAMLGNLPIVVRVWQTAASVCDDVVIATDDPRILQTAEEYGCRALLTTQPCSSGTERVALANQLLGESPRLIINLQGDEPFIKPEHLHLLVGQFESTNNSIATLGLGIQQSSHSLSDPNTVKVLVTQDEEKCYKAVDFLRALQGNPAGILEHIGVYAFTPQALEKAVELPPSDREKELSLEQLRWLEAGVPIRVAITDKPTIGIDTPQDLELAQKLLSLLH